MIISQNKQPVSQETLFFLCGETDSYLYRGNHIAKVKK